MIGIKPDSTSYDDKDDDEDEVDNNEVADDDDDQQQLENHSMTVSPKIHNHT